MSETCSICQKHQGEIDRPGGVIYEDDLCYAGHAFMPEGAVEDVYLGHLIVEPKRHVLGLAELTDDEARQLGWLITQLSRALKDCHNAEHVYLFVLGHHVEHLHYHVAPRYPGTPREYWGLRVDEWPDAPKGGVAQIEQVCDQVRKYLLESGL